MAPHEISSRFPTRLASLAFAFSIVCPLFLSGSLPAASAKHTPKKPAVEVAPGVAVEQPAEVQAPTAPHPPRIPHRPGAIKQPLAKPPASSDGRAGTGAGGAAKLPPAGGPAERRAHRRAERAAKQAQSEAAPAAGPQAKAQVQAKAQPQLIAQAGTSSKTRREREREERRRERERRTEREGHRETRKERQAREAREHEQPTPTPAPSLEAVAAATPSAPTVTSEPATPVSPLPKIVGEHAGRTTSSHGATRPASGLRQVKAQASTAATLGPVASSSPVAGSGTNATKASPSSRPAARPNHRSARSSSPLVTTVTRIIGVVPPLLWLLIGSLGLLALAFAVSSRLAARRAGRLARQRQALLEDVGLLQAALLPELPERLGPVATSAAYRPASGPGAGGDFYDVFGLPDGRLAVIVGDVSGHGRDALPHTTLLRFTLRAYIEAGLTPREALRTAAPVLERQLGGSFATVVIGVYNPRDRTLTYACAGHPHPLLSGLPADTAITACSAPPIGASRVTGTRQTVVRIPGGTVVLFYTDGVIESRIGEELFGVERLAGSLAAIADTATATSLLDRVSSEADRRPDDMAACLLRIEGGTGDPVVRSEELELDGRELARPRVRLFLAAAGIGEPEIERTLALAQAIVADHGNALLNVRMGDGPPTVSITHDNLAPFRARATSRLQEVAI